MGRVWGGRGYFFGAWWGVADGGGDPDWSSVRTNISPVARLLCITSYAKQICRALETDEQNNLVFFRVAP